MARLALAEWDPSLRSGFRLRAPAAAPRRVKTVRAGDPAALTPANCLNMLGKDVDSTHGAVTCAQWIVASLADDGKQSKAAADLGNGAFCFWLR